MSNACQELFSEPYNCDRQACALPFLSPAISCLGPSLILYTGCNYGLSKLVKNVDPLTTISLESDYKELRTMCKMSPLMTT